MFTLIMRYKKMNIHQLYVFYIEIRIIKLETKVHILHLYDNDQVVILVLVKEFMLWVSGV